MTKSKGYYPHNHDIQRKVQIDRKLLMFTWGKHLSLMVIFISDCVDLPSEFLTEKNAQFLVYCLTKFKKLTFAC
jgi:hypothetical protein